MWFINQIKDKFDNRRIRQSLFKKKSIYELEFYLFPDLKSIFIIENSILTINVENNEIVFNLKTFKKQISYQFSTDRE